MKKRSNDIQNLELLLDRFQMVQSVPEDIQEYLQRTQISRYNKIMKDLGRYSFAGAIFTAAYFILKKTGIALTVSKGIIITAIAVSVPVGVYVSAPKVVSYYQTVIAPSPISIIVQPAFVMLKDDKNSEIIHLKAVMDNSTQRDINKDAEFVVTPADLAEVTKQKDGYLLTFKKAGKGTLDITWQKMSSRIDISYEQKVLTEMEKLRQKYKHIEIVYLNDGTVLEGVLMDTDSTSIKLITPEGVLTVDKTDINKVEYGVRKE